MSTEPNSRQATASTASNTVMAMMLMVKRRYVKGVSVNVVIHLILKIGEQFGMQDGGKFP